MGSGVKSRKKINFLGFESPRLRENWHTEYLFFLSEFFQYNDDVYGDLYGDFYGDFYGIVDIFVATNFLISLSSSLYMILILFY